jgi:hypothetical protein
MSGIASEPPPSLVVECPECRGAIAVRGDLTYRVARCPLCAAEFLIPKPRRSGVPDTPTPHMGPAAARSDSPADLVAVPRPDPADESPPEPAGASLFSLPELAEEPPPSHGQPAGELAFREPEKTIETPEGTLRLRRLSPEERHARRTRRNVIMLCGGATILFFIVFLFRDKNKKR